MYKPFSMLASVFCSILILCFTSSAQDNSKAYFIQGAVRKPGVYQADGGVSLLKLITMAGGLSEKHGLTAIIIRPHKPDDEILEYERIIISINGLIKGHTTDNVMLKPGDIVDVPSQEVVYVMGEVNAPGSFPYVEGMSLRIVISLAQGTTLYADASDTVIYREDPLTGKRQEIRVDLLAIMAGRKNDIEIHRNDLIVVAVSIFKPILPKRLRFIDTPPLRGLPTTREEKEKRG